MSPQPPAPSTFSRWQLPDLGLGLGLRPAHVHDILDTLPDVGWFEVITENVLHHEGWFRAAVEAIGERYPLVLHGVSLSIGSSDPLPMDYLRAVKVLADQLEVAWVSDHVCWTGVGGRNSHDLLPVPYDERSLRWIVDRVRVVQDVLERPIMLENPSSYIGFTGSTMPEWAFHARLASEADCGLVLDVNNIYVSSVNHGFDPQAWLEAVPWDRVAHVHVAGHTDLTTHLLDTHIGPVRPVVWGLLADALARGGRRPVMLEWDDEIPPFAEVWREAQGAQAALHAAPRALSTPSSSLAATPRVRTGVSQGDMVATSRCAKGEHIQGALAEDQRWLFDVVAGAPGADRARIPAEVAPNARLQAHERVDIYRRMMRARFLEAMEADFLAVQRAVGPEVFAAWVADYLLAHPSQHWALEQLGAAFSSWLRSLGPAVSPPWLADVAALEWALVKAGWPAEQPSLAPDALAGIPPEALGDLRLKAAATTWSGEVAAAAVDPVAEAWQLQETLVADADTAETARQRVLVYRDGWQTQARVLSAEEGAVLVPLLGGASLAEALVSAAETVDFEAVTAALGAWAERWARERVVVALL